MKAVGNPSASLLDDLTIKTLYPQLFSGLTELNEAIDADFAIAFPRFLAELERDFSMEEQWMEDSGFQDVRMHRAEHAELLKLLHHAQARLLIGDCKLSRKIVPLLSPWFLHHISGKDAAWVTGLSKHALQEHRPNLRSAA